MTNSSAAPTGYSTISIAGALAFTGLAAGFLLDEFRHSLSNTKPVRSAVVRTQDAPVPKTVSGTEGGKTLTNGFERFRSQYYIEGEAEGLMEELVRKGADPDFLMITCIDPRSGGDLVFNSLPGQQFNHPQMGAVVPPWEFAPPELRGTVDYAVNQKKVKHLVIMGHSQCGGVKALVAQLDDENIGPWMQTARDALEAAKAKVGTADSEKLHSETERQVIIQSVKQVLDYPMVAKAVEEGRLTVSGWYFDMKNAQLMEYDFAADVFKQITLPTATEAQALKAPALPAPSAP